MDQKKITDLLEDLLKMDDVLACMVAKRGLEGIAPKGIKIKNIDLWQLIRKTTDEMFTLIDNYYDYGLNRLYFELGDYTVVIAPVSKAFSLLVVIPSLANRGLLDIEIENTKAKIKRMTS